MGMAIAGGGIHARCVDAMGGDAARLHNVHIALACRDTGGSRKAIAEIALRDDAGASAL
ncbi:hypothetical protein Y695_01797 [Hydrogenophaga sp. T4]|nr:hypothetical protein Y695_01797 [Hydrogenophaga sp. T4]